jgi:hypothetical protein
MDLTSMVTLVAALGVLVGLVLTILELRQLIIQRKMEMMMNIVPWFKMDNKEISDSVSLVVNTDYKNYEDFAAKYGDPFSGSGPVPRAFQNVSGFWDGLGLLYRKRIVDKQLVKEFYQFAVPFEWEKVKPIILGIREKNQEPELYNEFEYLAGEMRRER